jgi:hypothetical protein
MPKSARNTLVKIAEYFFTSCEGICNFMEMMPKFDQYILSEITLDLVEAPRPR